MTEMPLENICAPTPVDSWRSGYNCFPSRRCGHARPYPQARIVTIPGGTHLIVATHGQEIGRVAAQFIKETSANDAYYT
jgi:hypothetical protein